MQYVDQACTDCRGKYTAIDNAVVALQEARVLYQDDPGSVRQIDQQIDQLKGGITKNELARGMAGAISDKDKGIAALLLGAPSRVIAGASTVAVEQAASTEIAAATRASVDDKLARYLLNADHPIGGSKAQWFESALGFNAGNAEQLAKQIVFNESAAVQTSVIEEGVKI